MINQISVQNNNGRSPFKDFNTPKNGYYFLTPEPQTLISKDSEKKSHKLGMSIAASSLIVGFGLLGVMRGLPKNAGKYLDKLKQSIENKLTNLKMDKHRDKLVIKYNQSLKRVTSTLQLAQTANNMSSLKDVLFQKLMFKNSYTKKIHNFITNKFENISLATVENSYNKSNKKFSKLSKHMNDVNDKLLSTNPDAKIYIEGNQKTIAEWLGETSSRYRNVNTHIDTGFGKNAREGRYGQIKDAVEDLYDFFWGATFKDVKNFKSKKLYNTYIPEEFLVPAKMNLSNDANKLRKVITHDILDNYKSTHDALANIEKYINPKDLSSYEIVRQLKANLDAYKKLSGPTEGPMRLKINEQISANLKELSNCFNQENKMFKYDNDVVTEISKYIKDVDEILSSNSKGELQEILTIYKNLLPRNEYVKLRDKVNQAVKSLDKAIDIETNQFVDKVRDLKIGAAPLDVLSVLGSVGTIGYGLSKAKDKDERYSITLKYGIPVVGAIATSLYCTASLVSGGKAMALGMLSGLVMNKAGAIVDDHRKKIKTKVDQIVTPNQPKNEPVEKPKSV